MNYRVTHRTTYRYETPVSVSYSEARVLPRSLPHQSVRFSELVVDPVPVDERERLDFFGNRVAHFSLEGEHESLTVTATSVVEVQSPGRRTDPDARTSWEEVRRALATDRDPEVIAARQFVLDSPLVASDPSLEAFALASFARDRPLVDAVVDLSGRIHREFAYEPGATTISTHVTEVLERRHGVCQDFAHLAVGCLRSMGMAARYVSGYLETEPPDGSERLVGVDASHAWLSVFVPTMGWFDVDPTNDQVPDQRYITTAWGRDYADVTPIKGVVFNDGGEQDLTVSVDVERLERLER
ncbi:MAG: transglutaminase family protein [Acidimicrobiales bacterium]